MAEDRLNKRLVRINFIIADVNRAFIDRKAAEFGVTSVSEALRRVLTRAEEDDAERKLRAAHTPAISNTVNEGDGDNGAD